MRELFPARMKSRLAWALLVAVLLASVDVNQANDPAADSSTHQFNGIDFIQHDYIPQGSSAVDAATPKTPSKLVFRLMRHKADSKIFLIVGGREAGKSADLKKIALDLEADGISETVSVDLEANVPRIPASDWTPEQMFDRVLGTAQSQNFQNQLRDSPSKTNLLLDNFDRISDPHAREMILEYARDINKKGGGVVMTSTRVPEQSILTKLGDPTMIEIAPLSAKQIQSYLTEHWNLELRPEYSQKASVYAEAVSLILEKAQIPRDFGTMKTLSDIILNGNGMLDVEGKIFSPETSFRSASDYVLDKGQHAGNVLKFFDTMRLNKLELFHRLAPSSSSTNSPAADKFYRSVARDNVFGSKSVRPLDSAAAGFDRVYLDKGKFKFFRPEYEQYYAAQDIMDRLENHDANVEHDIIKVLETRELVAVAEFLEADITAHGADKFSSTLDKMLADPLKFNGVMDNLIVHGLDHLATAVTTKAKATQISGYFTDEAAMHLESSTKRQFGLITADVSGTTVSGTRLEMMLRKGMEKTVAVISSRTQPSDLSNIWSEEHVKALLKDIVLAEPSPSVEIYKYLANQLPGNTDVKFYNDMIEKTIDRASFEGHDIIMDLIERLKSRGVLTEEVKSNLMHDLVKNGDPFLLRDVVNKYDIPVHDSIPGSLVTAALDGHPFAGYSKPHFWQMMHYVFVENNAWQLPKPEEIEQGNANVELTATEKASPLHDLLVGTEDAIKLSEVEKFQILLENPLTELRPEILSARRNAILQDSQKRAGMGMTERLKRLKTAVFKQDQKSSLTLTEILIKTRGLDPLNPSEEQAFRETIESVLEIDMTKIPTDSEVAKLQKTIQSSVESAKGRKLTSIEAEAISQSVENAVKFETRKKLTLTDVEPVHEAIQEVFKSETGKIVDTKQEKSVLQMIDSELQSAVTNKLSLAQVGRMSENLAERIGTVKDLPAIRTLLSENIIPHLDPMAKTQVATIILKRTIKVVDAVKKSVTVKPLKEKLLETPADRNPDMTQVETAEGIELSEMRSELRRLMHDSPEPLPENPFSCAASSSGCRASSEVIKTFTRLTVIGDVIEPKFLTDDFLAELENAHSEGDYVREKQLVEMAYDAVELQKVEMMGERTAQFLDILQAGSLTDYHALNDMVTDLSVHVEALEAAHTAPKTSGISGHTKATLIFLIPIAVSGIDAIRKCVADRHSEVCKKAWQGFVIGVGMFAVPLGLPWVYTMTEKLILWARIQFLPNTITKTATSVALKAASALRIAAVLEFLSVAINAVFILVEIGYFIYHMVELVECLTKTDCNPAVRDIAIVNLVFGAVRIGLLVWMMIAGSFLALNPVIGAIIFVILWGLEKIVNAIIMVREFKKEYQANDLEGFYEFFDQLGMSVGTLAKSLKGRTIVIEQANKYADQLMKKYSDYVAVAMCAGYLSPEQISRSPPNYDIVNSYCEIHMDVEKPPNSIWAQIRVAPKEQPDMLRLGIPLWDSLYKAEVDIAKEDWFASPPDKIHLKETIFRCQNAIVIGHKNRWKKKADGKVYINLEHASHGTFSGHNEYHNEFYVPHDFTEPSTITGGLKSNSYMISSMSRTYLDFNPVSISETLDLRNSSAYSMLFYLFLTDSGREVFGILQFDKTPFNKLQWKNLPNRLDKTLVRTHTILGRKHLEDNITCVGDERMNKFITAPIYKFYIDGNGGVSNTIRDSIKNCHQNVIEPYTDYEANLNMSYSFFAKIRGIGGLSKKLTATYSTIHLLNDNQAGFRFSGMPFIINTLSMKYRPKTNVLTSTLQWTETTTLELDIKGIMAKYNTQTTNQTEQRKVLAISIYDECTNGSVLLHLPDLSNVDTKNQADTYDVTKISVRADAKVENFADALDMYHSLYSVKNPDFDLEVFVVGIGTLDYLFTFGRMDNDRIIFHDKAIYAAGFDGIDTYVITQLSPEYVWINNEASDNLMDYLAIPNNLGESLTIEYFTEDFPFVKHSTDDIVISFQTSGTTTRFNVVLQHYLRDEKYQHLVIQRDNNKNYMILPQHWMENPEQLTLFHYISMREKTQDAVYNVFPSDSECILHVFDINDQLEAHVINRVNVLLTFAQQNVSSVAVELHNFYQEDGKTVSKDWWYLHFIVADSFTENKRLITYNAFAIMELLNMTKINKEPSVAGYNLKKWTKGNVKMDRDVDESSLKKLPRPSLTLHAGLQIEEMSVIWSAKDKTISICVKNTTACLVVSNWCKSPTNRLKMITFNTGKPSVKFTNINSLECQKPYDGEQNSLVNSLQNHFNVAKKLFKLWPNNSDTDYYAFKQCVALKYMRFVTTIPMSRILNFENAYEEVKFQYDKCFKPKIMSKKYFETITLDQIVSLIKIGINSYNIKRQLPTVSAWKDADTAIALFEKYEPGDKWFDFLLIVYRSVYPNDPNPIDFKNLDMRRNGNVSLLPWYEKSIRFIQHCDSK